MAHNLEIINGSASFVSTKPEWHGLGKVFDAPLTTKVALEESRANFFVDKQPLVALTPELVTMMQEGKFANMALLNDYIITDKMATMRLDNNRPLGVIGKDYGVIQNYDAFSFIDRLCTGGTDAPCIESAGVLGNGERIFITAKFPQQVCINNNRKDLVDMYIVFTSSHDGSGAVKCMVTPIRVVCNNTLNMAIADEKRAKRGSWSLKHSKYANKRMDERIAAEAMNCYEVYKELFESRMIQLSQIHLSDKDVKRLAFSLVTTDKDAIKSFNSNGFKIVDSSEDISTKAKNKYYALMDTIESGVGQNILESGTGLHFYNGVTCWLDNVDINRYTNKQEEKFNSVMEGGIFKKQQECFDTLIALAS